jgi:hypothetical protein
MGGLTPSPSTGVVTAAQVWTYITRALTSPDDYKADVSGLAPAGEYDTEMGRITAARMAELDAANLPADIDTLLSRVTAARGVLIDSLGTPANFMADVSALLQLAHFDLSEFEIAQCPAAENAAVTIAVTTADQTLGSKDITVDIPAGGTIISVIALAKINIMNNSANAQKIDLKFDVEGTTLFGQSDVVGFGATDGASAVYVIAEDASDEVTADAQVVTLEAFATLSAAQSVIFSAQYYLFITYKMG